MENKIAILILVHKKPNQFARLVNSLKDERFDLFVHVDKKSDIHQFEDVVKNNLNVYFVKERFKTYFFDYSLVNATCSCLIAARSKYSYRYFVLLTGQDYPIKPLDYIYNFLQYNYPMCWIDMLKVDEAWKCGGFWANHLGLKYVSQKKKRFLQDIFKEGYFTKYGKVLRGFVRAYDELLTLVKGKPKAELDATDYKYSCGSHFWMIPDICAETIIKNYQNDKTLQKIFTHIGACEETYFQTSLSTHPHLLLPDGTKQFSCPWAEMDNPALRLIKWYENGVKTNGHPAIWKIEDFYLIKKAKALFARKFDEDVDKNILDKIDMEILRN